MNRVDIQTGALILEETLKCRLNASFPEDADFSQQGYPFVMDDPKPELTTHQDAKLGDPWNDQGIWRRSWTIIDVPPDYSSLSINRHQAKIALLRHGLLDTVETIIAHGSAEMQLAWKEAPQFRRNSPTLLAMAAALKLSDAEVNKLFNEAMSVDI